MLVLSRRPGEHICVGDNITIRFLGVQGSQIRVGIEAPRDLIILRGELQQQQPGRTVSGSSLGRTAVLT